MVPLLDSSVKCLILCNSVAAGEDTLSMLSVVWLPLLLLLLMGSEIERIGVENSECYEKIIPRTLKLKKLLYAAMRQVSYLFHF